MADQQFCLRWNNHQSTLISVFDTLLENGTLVDCTLAAEGQYLKAHKVVLSACSPYLETLLSQHYEKHPIVILKDVKFTELKSMMDYMYRGEVNISQDQLGTFLKAAESLQIKGLSENGEGDARDVGSTTRPQAVRKTPTTPTTRPEPEAAASPAHRSRDGSVSPTSRKRRRLRRNSDDADNHLDTNSCDLPNQAQSTPIVPTIPASITTTPIPKTPLVKPEVNDRLDHNSLPPESGLLKEKIEPAEPLLEPKTEYLEDLNNDDSVEDLTLDDDDEMDMSQMSNMSNMSRPGPSHGTDLSNQGFTPWQLGNQSGTDEVFMAAQEAVNAHRDSQDAAQQPRRERTARSEPRRSRDLVSARPPSVSGRNTSNSTSEPRTNGTSETSNRYKCNKCGKICKYNLSRRLHQLWTHKKFGCGRAPQFYCILCETSVIGRNDVMTIHKKPSQLDFWKNWKATSERTASPFISGSISPNVEDHMHLDSEERSPNVRYKCSQCWMHQLWMHKKFGYRQAPQFYCISCDKSFVKKDVLMIHKKNWGFTKRSPRNRLSEHNE